MNKVGLILPISVLGIQLDELEPVYDDYGLYEDPIATTM